MAENGFSAEERAALKQRAEELRAQGKKGIKQADLEQAVVDTIAKMQPNDRTLAERLHALVADVAPQLGMKTWYGFPAYTDANGKVVVFFKEAGRFDDRYATLGFESAAQLDDGPMWPTSFALIEWTPAVDTAVRAMVAKAAG